MGVFEFLELQRNSQDSEGLGFRGRRISNLRVLGFQYGGGQNNSPRPRPKRSEVPIRIPSIPHLLIPSPLTPTPQKGHRGGGGGVPLCEPINEPQGPAVKFRRLQWIWAVCGRGDQNPGAFPLPSPPPPPLRVLSHYLSVYLSIYLSIYIYIYIHI